jgi:hypothetical protein
LPTITGASTLACLLAASISVEAVTPPIWDGPFKELLPILVEGNWKSTYLKN